MAHLIIKRLFMSNKKNKIISIVILAIIIFGAYYGVMQYNKPHVNVEMALTSTKLTPDFLLNDFSTNEQQANLQYLDHVIEINGKISDIDISDGNGIIIFENDEAIGSVRCYLSPKENKKLMTLKVGQDISLKGICTGYLLDVIMIRCIIVKS
ncbi:hypothetical protein V3A08_08685 [Tenacibaculum maritimum]|uniref:OB-fold protein n=2 Tax=Tenacibaculum maritimum TaxID=107401 RepID=UPI0013301976|nr:hypothetical protein [Tenacibaculum maritimum]